MEISEAIRQVEGIGLSYFYDFVEEDNIDAILQQIIEHVMRSQITGESFWVKRRDGLRAVLPVLKDEDLNRMMKNKYGIWPEKVGGGRAFLQRLYDVISEAIEKNLKKGS